MLHVLALLFLPLGHDCFLQGLWNSERAACQKAVYHVAARNTNCASYLMKSDECLAVLRSRISQNTLMRLSASHLVAVCEELSII